MNLSAWRQIALRNARHARWVAALWLMPLLGSLTGLWRLHSAGFVFLAMLSFAAIVLLLWARWERERTVREGALPHYLKRKLRDTYPQLSPKDCELVERGLRQFFLCCLRSNRQFVAMPSKVVDAMWHEFILHTRAYRDWCEAALGWFVHHTPAEALGAQAQGNDGLRRAWYWACRDESIQPRRPTRLPLLFALDMKLNIAEGFRYAPDCKDIRAKSAAGGDGKGQSYCGTDFSDDSYSGDAGSMGGSEASGSGDGGSDGGGDGDGDGGGGDGGGCGGGD